MLLLLTIALVLVGAVALVIGFVNDAMFPIYLSIACSLAAAVVLVIFSRLSKSRLDPAAAPGAIGDEATGPVLIGRDADFPITDYDDRRVADIVPLLADLDRDELELVREREAAGRNRTTIVRRIDDLIAETDSQPDDDEDSDALAGAVASFSRDDDDVDADEDIADDAVGGDLFPIADYDELSVAEILPLLDELTLDELEEVGDREADGQNRAAVLDRVDELLDEGEAAEAAAPKKAAAKTTAKKAVAVKATGKKATTTKKAAAKKATTVKKAAATKATTAKKAAAKKSPAKKSPAAKKAAPSKAGAKKSPAKKSPAKRAR